MSELTERFSTAMSCLLDLCIFIIFFLLAFFCRKNERKPTIKSKRKKNKIAYVVAIENCKQLQNFARASARRNNVNTDEIEQQQQNKNNGHEK